MSGEGSAEEFRLAPSRDTARTAFSFRITPEPMAKSRIAWMAGTAAA